MSTSYWSLVESFWEEINIYDGPEVFNRTYLAVPETSRLLFAAHFAQSEICNGGFRQFFYNSTGVLGPEALDGFRRIGMEETADTVAKAMECLGQPYPRDREERKEKLSTLNVDDLNQLDDKFFDLIDTENGGFEAAADRFAASCLT